MRRVLYLFGQLTDADVEWMGRVGVVQRMAPGQVLIEEGDSIRAVYVVLGGVLSVRVQAAGDREIARRGVGEVLGELSFVDTRPASATVAVVEPAWILAVPRDLLARRMSSDPAFAARFYRAIAMFLAIRLRRAPNWLGVVVATTEPEGGFDEDELDLETVDDAQLAGVRFDQLLDRLRR